MKIEITYLLTIKNYATMHGITPSYIYKMIKEGKMNAVIIDGVQFIDTKSYPTIPSKK